MGKEERERERIKNDKEGEIEINRKMRETHR